MLVFCGYFFLFVLLIAFHNIAVSGVLSSCEILKQNAFVHQMNFPACSVFSLKVIAKVVSSYGCLHPICNEKVCCCYILLFKVKMKTGFQISLPKLPCKKMTITESKK